MFSYIMNIFVTSQSQVGGHCTYPIVPDCSHELRPAGSDPRVGDGLSMKSLYQMAFEYTVSLIECSVLSPSFVILLSSSC